MRNATAITVLVLLLAAGVASVAWADDTPPAVTDSTTTTGTETTTVPAPAPVDMAKVRALRKGIVWNIDAAHRWETTSFVPLAKTSYMERHTTSIERLGRLLKWWTFVRLRAKKYAQNPPHKTQWLCIHHYEGSWTDPWDPYWGGVQMDHRFMATYGARFVLKYGGRVWRDSIGPNSSGGEANKWTPLEQMWTAEQAYKAGRGFYPWPNTARYCGYI